MKPAYKRTPNDCCARCVESLVGHLTGPVPNFIVGSPEKGAKQWMVARMNRWLKRYGLGLVFVNLDNDRKRLFSMAVPTYCILFCYGVDAGEPWGHAVVARVQGRKIEVAHDPDHFEGPYDGSMKLKRGVRLDAVGFIVHGDTVARGPIPKPPAENPDE